MAAMTMTEGLAELKTILKRLEKKRATLLAYLWRQNGLRDPMEKEEGGSVGHIARERQAIRDLETRYVAIRTAIQAVNQTTDLTVGGETKQMAEWLNWRKEIAGMQKSFVDAMRKSILDARKNAATRGFGVVTQDKAGVDTPPLDIVINADEKALNDEAENLETILGTLDGQLSLKLATTTIDV